MAAVLSLNYVYTFVQLKSEYSMYSLLIQYIKSSIHISKEKIVNGHH